MPVDRKLLTEPLFLNRLPAWPCPTCERGHLTLIESLPPRIRSAAACRHLLPEYDNTYGDYGIVSLVAQCSNCEEAFSICGQYRTERGYDSEGEPFPQIVCIPVAITPSIHPIKFPPQCPEIVKKQFLSAFSIMWQDPNASLNRVRTALEIVMDIFKIPRTRVAQNNNGSRRRTRLDLHIRIERLAEKRKSVKDVEPALLAVKYLGNEGTHDTSATLNDLFDALDLSEELLFQLFNPSRLTNRHITSEVLKRKGRRKPKKT